MKQTNLAAYKMSSGIVFLSDERKGYEEKTFRLRQGCFLQLLPGEITKKTKHVYKHNLSLRWDANSKTSM